MDSTIGVQSLQLAAATSCYALNGSLWQQGHVYWDNEGGTSGHQIMLSHKINHKNLIEHIHAGEIPMDLLSPQNEIVICL